MITTDGPIGPDDPVPAEDMPRTVQTLQTRTVLLALLDQPQREQYAADLADRLGMYPSTARAILRRLYRRGWMVRRRESADEIRSRPVRGPQPKWFYRLTISGAARARRAVTQGVAR